MHVCDRVGLGGKLFQRFTVELDGLECLLGGKCQAFRDAKNTTPEEATVRHGGSREGTLGRDFGHLITCASTTLSSSSK